MRITIDTSHIRDVLKLSKAESVSFIATATNTKIVAQELDEIAGIKNQITKKIYSGEGEQGKTVISRRILNLLPLGEVTITDTELTIGTRNISYVANKEVATVIETLPYKILQIPNGEFKQGLNCAYARATDESRPVLQGLCIENKDFVSLDGYRLAIRKSNWEAKEQLVLSPNLVSILKKAKFEEVVSIYADSNYVEIEDGNLFILGRRMEEKYVSYKSLIPQEANTEVVLRTELLLNILKFYKKADIGIVTLKIEDNKLTVKGNNGEATIEDSIAVTTKGEKVQISFNIIYLIEALKNYNDLATFKLTSSVSPLVIEAEGKLELVLPIRIIK